MNIQSGSFKNWLPDDRLDFEMVDCRILTSDAEIMMSGEGESQPIASRSRSELQVRRVDAIQKEQKWIEVHDDGDLVEPMDIRRGTKRKREDDEIIIQEKNPIKKPKLDKPQMAAGWNAEWRISKEPLLNTLDRLFQKKIPSVLSNIVAEYLQVQDVFDEAQWKKYFDSSGTPSAGFPKLDDKKNIVAIKAPPLPKHIESILQDNCPFFPGRKIKDTHMLIYIPSFIGTTFLSISVMESMSKEKNKKAKFAFIDDNILNNDVVQHKGKWILITKKNIPDSLGKSSEDQNRLLETAAAWKWKVPTTRDLVIASFARFLFTGEWFFLNNFSRTTDAIAGKIVVVGDSDGLRVTPFRLSHRKNVGIVAMMEFT